MSDNRKYYYLKLKENFYNSETMVRHGALGLKDLAVISDSHALPELKECTFRIACDVT